MAALLVIDKGERELIRGLGRPRRQRRFLVQLSPGDDPDDAARAAGVPQYNEVHPVDSYQFVRQVRILRNPAGPAWYDLEIDYGEIGAVIGGTVAEPSFAVHTESGEYPADHDANGVAYANSLGHLFEVTTTRRKSDTAIVGTVWLAGFNFGYSFTHVDRVNSKPLACLGGAPAGTVWLRGYHQTEARLPSGVACVKMTLDLVVRDYYVPAGKYAAWNGSAWALVSGDAQGKIQLGWQKVVMNTAYEGFEDAVPAVFKDTDGNRLRVPAKISLAGNRLADDAEPYYLCFTEFPPADFSQLGMV